METLKSMSKEKKDYDSILAELNKQFKSRYYEHNHNIIAEFFRIKDKDLIVFIDDFIGSYTHMRKEYDFLMDTPLREIIKTRQELAVRSFKALM